MKSTATFFGFLTAIGVTGLALAQSSPLPEVAPPPTPVRSTESNPPGDAVPPLPTLPAPEPPASPDQEPPHPAVPKVVHHKWADGEFWTNGSQWIVRQRRSDASSTNIISNSGNGWGNRIVVDSGTPTGSVTVIHNSRNGIGNRIVVDGVELRINSPTIPTWVYGPARTTPDRTAKEPVYPNRGQPFWSEKVWSDTYRCYLYWCPRSERWFRYHPAADEFRPIPSAAAKTNSAPPTIPEIPPAAGDKAPQPSTPPLVTPEK